jgi:cyclopropane fatty-acyl-phospholipid synthase-like methyltransferase
LALLTARLPSGASILDIGCGSGVPIARTLAAEYHVTGVDLSQEQIRRAQQIVPNATFLHGDIMAMTFPAATFDAVVAFYAIFHLPREEHPALFQRIATWLKPGGYLLATVSAVAEDAYTEDDFLGVTMYWSNYGLADYRALAEQFGFQLLSTALVGSGFTGEAADPAEHHPLLFAQLRSES